MGDINKRNRLVPLLPKPKNVFDGLKATTTDKDLKLTTFLRTSMTSNEEKIRVYKAKRLYLLIGKVVQLLKSVERCNVKRRYRTKWPSYPNDGWFFNNNLDYLGETSLLKYEDSSVSPMIKPLPSIRISDQVNNSKFKIKVRSGGNNNSFRTQICKYSDLSNKNKDKEYVSNDEKKHCSDHLGKTEQEKANENKTTNEVFKGDGNKVTSRSQGLSSRIQLDFSSLTGQKGKYQTNTNDCLCEERLCTDKVRKPPKKKVINKQGATHEYPITIPIGRKLEVYTLNNMDDNGRRLRSIWIRIDNIPEDIEMIKINSDMTNIMPQTSYDISKQSLNKTVIKNCMPVKKLGNKLIKITDDSAHTYSLGNANSHARRRIWDNIPKDKTEILERVLAFKETVKEFRQSKEKLEKQVHLRSGRKRF